jgi:hypothetical protein
MASPRLLPASHVVGSILAPSWATPFSPEVAESGAGTLTTDRTTYRPGDHGKVTLRNDGPRALGFCLCPRQLEQQLGDMWLVRERSPGPGEVCTAELCVLQPGAAASTGFRLARALPPATYRWRFLSIGGLAGGPSGSGARLTNTFRVEA